jgi:hypothetical protein
MTGKASAAQVRVVYRRLLAYARPWRGTFLIGVAGMALYASTEAGIAWFVDQFLKYAFVDPDPRAVWAVPLGALLLFLIRGAGDFLATAFPGRVGRPFARTCSPSTCTCPRPGMTANPPRACSRAWCMTRSRSRRPPPIQCA